jgi:hypothetical protein
VAANSAVRHQLGDLIDVLREADPDRKQEVPSATTRSPSARPRSMIDCSMARSSASTAMCRMKVLSIFNSETGSRQWASDERPVPKPSNARDTPSRAILYRMTWAGRVANSAASVISSFVWRVGRRFV